MKVRKKPVEVDAWPWGEYPEVPDVRWPQPYRCFITTLEGRMEATEGDWLIRGVNGEYYPCKPDIFEKTYDIVG